MFLDINKIEPEGQRIDVDLALGSLSGPGGDDVIVASAHLGGHARPRQGAVELDARLVATLELSCSRCLARFEHGISVPFFLVLVPDPLDDGPARKAEIEERDIARFHADEGRASLADIAVEQIYLHLPLKAICRPDCRGLCPECGTDRNQGRCDCEQAHLDPRLAPLLELKKHRTAG
jgi:uncharacterized protein